MTPAEKRSMERFQLTLPARVIPKDIEDSQPLELLTSDICAGGAFFQTDSPLTVGTEVKIDLVLPLDRLKELVGKKAHIKVSGFVVRATATGMAVCFEPDYEIRPLTEEA